MLAPTGKVLRRSGKHKLQLDAPGTSDVRYEIIIFYYKLIFQSLTKGHFTSLFVLSGGSLIQVNSFYQ